MEERQTLSYRQDKIKELIKKRSISDQHKIVELLKENYGIETNQAVVSRDLRNLGIVKKSIQGMMVYECPTIDVRTEMLKLALVDISHNEAMIVIKTHPGLAAFVGDCLDEYADLEILGCLSGENVVFAAPKTVKKIEKVYQAICEKFQFKK